MASIKKNILGEVRGKVGDKVFKIRDNKGYVASAPSTYSMSNSPSAIANRDIKKVTGKFSSMVYNVEILKNDCPMKYVSSKFNQILRRRLK